MTEPPLSPTGRSRKAKSWIGTAVGQTVAVVIGISIVGLLILAVKIPIVGFIVGLIVLLVVFIGKGLLGLERREFWRFKAPPAKSEELKGQSAQSDQPDLARLRRKTFFWVITACVSGVLAYMGNVIPSGSDWMAVPEIALVICVPACFIAWRLWRVYHLALRRVMALQAKSEGPQGQLLQGLQAQSVQELQGQSVQGLQGQSVQGLQGQSVQSDQPPVLYLRSFDQDQKTAKRKGSWTEEEYLAQLLTLIGPVIAIGRPGEKLPEVGARRLYVNDDEWQSTVEGLMKSSRLVAIRTGRSSGLRWEFRKCLELLRPEQLLLVVSSEAELNEMLTDMGTLSPTTPSFQMGTLSPTTPSSQLGWRSIASIRAFVIFRESWKPFLLRVKSSRFWYTKQVDSSYIQPRLAYTLRPLFEQLGVPWPKPAISGRNLGTSLSLIGLLVWCIYLIFYPGAADKENARAMFDTGLRYEYGRGSWPQDYAKAREKYEEAAAKGNASAMNHLGALYANGHGVAQDYAKAREWYEKAAADGDTYAVTNLGVLYEYGRGVPQDYAKAREWYEKAAAKGNTNAMISLGVLYDNGYGVTKDHAKAREWYEKAAAKGDASAMTNLGVLYANGKRVPRDYAKAHEWYQKAAANGDTSAMTNLGALYEYGRGVPQDDTEARKWYEKAAAKGNANAMIELGVRYANGHGVPQDYAKAREWFKKAADKGDALAMTNLGWLYATGHGVAQDYAKAREWYEKAAAKGEASAMTNLGWLYDSGHGVAQDYAKAREWWEKAADKGDENAKAQLKRLPIKAAAAAGRYAEALHLQEGSAAEVEAEETKREGKPGEETAGALGEVAWHALFAGEFTKALTVADRAHALLPNDLMIETNRAHALMFVGHGHESEALYLAHKGKPLSLQDRRLWERAIAEDFAEFRKSGLTHPMMADIERKLGVSR